MHSAARPGQRGFLGFFRFILANTEELKTNQEIGEQREIKNEK